MRDHMEAWLDEGGRCARFAGNFCERQAFSAAQQHAEFRGGSDRIYLSAAAVWQVRFESDHDGGEPTPELRTDLQVCHKYGAAQTDPVMGTEEQGLLTYDSPSDAWSLVAWSGCVMV